MASSIKCVFISVLWLKLCIPLVNRKAAVRSMRSWPLNMDDELWATWVWIIHMQGDCRTLLEWLPHIYNKGLINTHNSDYDYHQRRHQPTVLFSAQPVDRLGRVSIILCQQKLKLNTAGFLWHCIAATHSQFRFLCMCTSTSSWWHLYLYFSSITLHLSVGVIISPPPSDAQWSLSGCIRAVSLRHWTYSGANIQEAGLGWQLRLQ